VGRILVIIQFHLQTQERQRECGDRGYLKEVCSVFFFES